MNICREDNVICACHIKECFDSAFRKLSLYIFALYSSIYRCLYNVEALSVSTMIRVQYTHIPYIFCITIYIIVIDIQGVLGTHHRYCILGCIVCIHYILLYATLYTTVCYTVYDCILHCLLLNFAKERVRNTSHINRHRYSVKYSKPEVRYLK
jgi:hypothetical protein